MFIHWIAYFDKLGVREFKDQTNVGPILAITDGNFKLPLKYPDKIYIAGRSAIERQCTNWQVGRFCVKINKQISILICQQRV